MVCTQGFSYLVGIVFVNYQQIGLILGMLVYIDFLMLCNLFTPIKDMPQFFQLSSLISFPNFIYNSNLIIIYGLDRCPPDYLPVTLYKLELDDQQLWFNLKYLFAYSISLRIFAFILLYIQNNKFFKNNNPIDFNEESEQIFNDREKHQKLGLKKTVKKVNHIIDYEMKENFEMKSSIEVNNKLSIAWIDLTLKTKKQLFSEENIILRQLNGFIEFGTINALMGSSGAGKTSLLKCINGRNSDNLKISEESKIYLSRFEKITTCFVCQDVRQHLLKGLTAKQAIIYASKLKNSQHINFDHEINAKNLMVEFLISDIEDTNVENCSGGEQKRLVIAMELTSSLKPNLICIDEPTSGLDSNAAEVVSLKFLLKN
jgi:ABC-type lipoprotein export system ATPase subunit